MGARPKVELTPGIEAKIHQMNDEGWTLKEMANELAVTVGQLQTLLKKMGVSKRHANAQYYQRKWGYHQ